MTTLIQDMYISGHQTIMTCASAQWLIRAEGGGLLSDARFVEALGHESPSTIYARNWGVNWIEVKKVNVPRGRRFPATPLHVRTRYISLQWEQRSTNPWYIKFEIICFTKGSKRRPHAVHNYDNYVKTFTTSLSMGWPAIYKTHVHLWFHGPSGRFGD